MSGAGQAQEILRTLLPEDVGYRPLPELAVEVCGVVEQLERRIAEMEKQRRTVLRIHRQVRGHCAGCDGYDGKLGGRKVQWPCSTVRALNA